MVSDSELIERLQEFLRVSDLNTTTTGSVRRKLEEEFGVDLTEKKAFIREQVDLFLQSHLETNADDDDVNHEVDDQTVEDEPQNDGDEDQEIEQEDEEQEEDDDDSKTGSQKVRKRGGFTKLWNLSPELQEFVGVPQMARTEVVKQLWVHIREKNLQDPSNKKNILCDEQLRSLFDVDSIDMFQMNKALTKHILPLDSDAEKPEKPARKEKKRKQEIEEDPDVPKPKRQTGFLAPLQLSDALVRFLGTGESELSRSDVVKRMWEYIKQNNLQDPSDKRMIICDEKLKKLFDVESFQGFTVSKLLTAHFVKT
ncbi:upstream activation factor subunit UAF30-like [Rutidosis leptorrhynchoides]|uniref:upstream activation factor subunit UAF30-like n=1 Tax=Rutidosis leptorrhynchoides TaxID=125765 RepID=UPI003A9A5F8E